MQFYTRIEPSPGAYTWIGGKMVKLYDCVVAQAEKMNESSQLIGFNKKEGLLITTADGVIGIKVLQPEGKKKMDAAAYWAGNYTDHCIAVGKKEEC